MKKVIFMLFIVCCGLILSLYANAGSKVVIQPLVTDGQSFEEWIEVEAKQVDPMTISSSNDDSGKWTGWNKFWFASAIGGQAADVVSTQVALNKGCVEGNPVFGKDPSTGLMVAVKLGVVGVAYYITEVYMDGHSQQADVRNWAYGGLAVLGFGAAGWNASQSCN